MNKKHHPEILDSMIEIFSLVLTGDGEYSRRREIALIRKLDAVGRRDLRAALQRLDYLLDDVTLEEFLQKRIPK
jgi:hypothetical protein